MVAHVVLVPGVPVCYSPGPDSAVWCPAWDCPAECLHFVSARSQGSALLEMTISALQMPSPEKAKCRLGQAHPTNCPRGHHHLPHEPTFQGRAPSWPPQQLPAAADQHQGAPGTSRPSANFATWPPAHQKHQRAALISAARSHSLRVQGPHAITNVARPPPCSPAAHRAPLTLPKHPSTPSPSAYLASPLPCFPSMLASTCLRLNMPAPRTAFATRPSTPALAAPPRVRNREPKAHLLPY